MMDNGQYINQNQLVKIVIDLLLIIDVYKRQTMMTAIVSPIARPIPSTIPATTPDFAAGRTTAKILLSCVAPSASAPS